MKRVVPLLVAITWLAAAPLPAADWVRWRGPTQDGVAYDRDLPDHWSPDPQAPHNNLVWKAAYGGRSTPIIMGDRVYLITSAGEGVNAQERIMCFHADTGDVLWQYKFNVFDCDLDILRVGWTQLAGDSETGNIYALGTSGMLLCLSKDGKLVW